eukprot:TRINITY_DN731_c0_g1_i1.p1 TRINITY_DN731_c0_g1~~TRINITY_DN731_c0_g1_i1.p1  ORF type:complete len:290 (-),score=121.24 TRINITY_DN731_c0_g1_i1:39-908(-)
MCIRDRKIEVQEALEAQKADFARREEQYWRREQIIKKKDLDLQENLIRFNKFLQENDTKRTRAEKKHVEEEKKKIEYTAQIEEHKHELESLKRQHDELQYKLERNQKYMHFLELTCENQGDEFGEPLELQHRHETLGETNQDLLSRRHQCDNELNERQKEIRKRQQERATETQVKNTKIAQMRKRLEETKTEVYNLSQQAEKKESKKLERTHQIGQVRMALDNTFARCVKTTTLSSKAEKIKDLKDPTAQLDFIHEFLMDMTAIQSTYLKEKRELAKRKEDEVNDVDRY